MLNDLGDPPDQLFRVGGLTFFDELQEGLVPITTLTTGFGITFQFQFVDGTVAATRRFDITRAKFFVLTTTGAIGMIALPRAGDTVLARRATMLRSNASSCSCSCLHRNCAVSAQLQPMLANIVPGRRRQDRIGIDAEFALALMRATE